MKCYKMEYFFNDKTEVIFVIEIKFGYEKNETKMNINSRRKSF